MAARKKSPNLSVVEGGGQQRSITLAVDRPLLISIVPSSELDPARGLAARHYIKPEDKKAHSGISPAFQSMVRAAKHWRTSMIRLAKSEGYTNMKKFFIEAKKHELTSPADHLLFNQIEALLQLEKEFNSHVESKG